LSDPSVGPPLLDFIGGSSSSDLGCQSSSVGLHCRDFIARTLVSDPICWTSIAWISLTGVQYLTPVVRSSLCGLHCSDLVVGPQLSDLISGISFGGSPLAGSCRRALTGCCCHITNHEHFVATTYLTVTSRIGYCPAIFHCHLTAAATMELVPHSGC
jgi:hypothetical protein